MVTGGERCGGSTDCEFGTDKYALLYLKYKSLLLKMKEESEKADLKLNIKKTKIMASGPIPSWQIEKMATVTDFIFLGSKSLWMVTIALKLEDTCSLEGKL